MRKTIYVPSEEVWKAVKEKAKGMKLSVSQYLLGGNHVPEKVSAGQLDRLEVAIKSLETRIVQETKGLVEDVVIPEKTWRDTDRTTRGDMAVPRSDDEVIGEAQVKGVREKYKLANPRKICPLCNNFNKDCVC